MKRLLLSLSISFISFFALVSCVQADSADIYFSSTADTYQVGNVFNVNLIINSGGEEGINASEGTIRFDPKYLLVKKVDTDKSIFNFWKIDPIFSNKNGNITYNANSSLAYKGETGSVMTISFLALQKGDTSLKFSGVEVISAGENNVNILKSNPEFKISLEGEGVESAEVKAVVDKKEDTEDEKPKDPLFPVVNSDTNPNEESWHNMNFAEFEWTLPEGVDGVSIMVTPRPTSNPGPLSDGLMSSKKFENLKDGTHYLHIKFRKNGKWGPILHRKVLIDTVNPEPFELSIDNKGDVSNSQPDILFEASDKLSGIGNYVVNLGGKSVNIPIEDFEKKSYALPKVKAGTHKVEVIAFDKAGNSVISSKDFFVEPLKTPIISEISEKVTKGNKLDIKGDSVYPNSTVKIYVNKNGKEVTILNTKTNTDGSWEYSEDHNLKKGEYELYVKVVKDGVIESDASERKKVIIASNSIIKDYNNLITKDYGRLIDYGVIVLIVILLIYFFIIIKKYLKNRKKGVSKEEKEIENVINEVFKALKEEVEETMDEGEDIKDAKEKILEALGISEEFINKEIKEIEKNSK